MKINNNNFNNSLNNNFNMNNLQQNTFNFLRGQKQ